MLRIVRPALLLACVAAGAPEPRGTAAILRAQTRARDGRLREVGDARRRRAVARRQVGRVRLSAAATAAPSCAIARSTSSDEHTVRSANGAAVHEQQPLAALYRSCRTRPVAAGAADAAVAVAAEAMLPRRRAAANRNKVGVDRSAHRRARRPSTTFSRYALSERRVARRAAPLSGRRDVAAPTSSCAISTPAPSSRSATSPRSAWSDDGALLAMAIDVDGKTGNGVQLLNAQTRRDSFARRERRAVHRARVAHARATTSPRCAAAPTARSSTRATP